MQNFELTITHLYPDKMNLYGDLGNVIALRRRAKKRGISINIKAIKVGDHLTARKTDIYFFGGGQDSQQIEIADDLMTLKKSTLLEDLNAGTPALAICGGYQLLGKYYLTGDGGKAEGIGFFPIETIAPGPDVQQRCIGNISTHIVHSRTMDEIRQYYAATENNIHEEMLMTLTGFENHSGRTRLISDSNDDNLHLSKVISGIGDSEKQGYEGIRYKNAFGSYMHGSFLPKNPHMTDLILSLALKRKYENEFMKLKTIEDQLEWRAHHQSLKIKG